MIFAKRFARLFLAFAATVGLVATQTCYPDMNFPMSIGQNMDDKQTWMDAAASSVALNAIFVGGMSEADHMNAERTGRRAIILRMDMG